MQIFNTPDDLEKINMDEYAQSFYTQEGYSGPSLAEINDWGHTPFAGREQASATADPTNPDHYQNTDKKYEHRFVAKAWGLEYYLGCATKYIARCGKKSSVGMSDVEKEIQDLKKSMVYIQFRIDELEGE
jgi:hypothetical protein